MKDRKESFGDYLVIHADYEMAHLWLVDLPVTDEAGNTPAPAEPKQLAKEDTFMEENENWFNHYIWGDPLPESPTPVVKPAKP